MLIYLNKKALKYNTLNKGHICIFENLNISKESKGYQPLLNKKNLIRSKENSQINNLKHTNKQQYQVQQDVFNKQPVI